MRMQKFAEELKINRAEGNNIRRALLIASFFQFSLIKRRVVFWHCENIFAEKDEHQNILV